MALRYLAVAVLAAGATYAGMTLARPHVDPTAVARPAQTCSFVDKAGDPLAIEQGPLGPRLGSLDYIASNLTQTEKVDLVSSNAFDATGVLERMATDLVRNRKSVANDIAHSIKSALGGQ